MVLENQISFYILDKLYTTVVPETYQVYERFIGLASEYFKSFDPYARFDPVETLLKPDKDSKISSKSGNNRSANGPQKRYSARLQEYGINNAKRFTDLIRSFYVNDLELKLMPSTNARSAAKLREAGINPMFAIIYASLLDSLIHTRDDVELLVEKEVIVHELGSNKAVAVLVNGLYKNVMTNGTCYKGLMDDLNKHYESPWNHTMAALNLVYFRDTWRTSSTVIGIAILVYPMLNLYKLLRGFFS
ncbi:uncharacterized protein LOC114738886 [Neltuma alba]|uniref:uncharacterized protein LOC114738886 n=1 Tax=Neltuma alba TaxID=207710 RepID=UPI0010A37391|nr:uncharacterized protein LOC114738886 [Prosopis alba]